MVPSIVLVEKNNDVEAFKLETGAIVVGKTYMQGMGSASAQPYTPTEQDMKKLTRKDLEELLSKGMVPMPKRPTKQWMVDKVVAEWENIKTVVSADLRRAKRSQQARELLAWWSMDG